MPMNSCKRCGGFGQVSTMFWRTATCPDCNGTGMMKPPPSYKYVPPPPQLKR